MTFFETLPYLLLLCVAVRWCVRLFTPSPSPRVPLMLNVLAMGTSAAEEAPAALRRPRRACPAYRRGALQRCLVCNASRRAHELT